MTSSIFQQLCQHVRFDLNNEKVVQQQVKDLLIKNNLPFSREHVLDQQNIPDFFFKSTGLCVEVKIKGSKKAIYRQVLRYSEFDQVKTIVLLTNKSMSLPAMLNNKPTAIINMGLAWL